MTRRFALILAIFALLLTARSAFAQENCVISTGASSSGTEPLVYVPDITIPGFIAGHPVTISLTTVGEYIRGLFVAFVWAVGILAVVMVIYGGIKWVAAAGDAGRIKDAKDVVMNAIIGLIIALTTVVLLNIINPDLTTFPGIGLNANVKQCIFTNPDYLPATATTTAPPSGDLTDITYTSQFHGVDMYGDSFKVNTAIAPETKAAIDELAKLPHFSLNKVTGQRNQDRASCHITGMAIDINADQNYCVDCYFNSNQPVGGKNVRNGAKAGTYFHPSPSIGDVYTPDDRSVTQAVVAIMKKYGFCWGGNWPSFHDYMHFSSEKCQVNGHNECHLGGTYDFTKSVQENQQNLGISWPGNKSQ